MGVGGSKNRLAQLERQFEDLQQQIDSLYELVPPNQQENIYTGDKEEPEAVAVPIICEGEVRLQCCY